MSKKYENCNFVKYDKFSKFKISLLPKNENFHIKCNFLIAFILIYGPIFDVKYFYSTLKKTESN